MAHSAATLSPYYLITLSPYHPITLLPYHHFCFLKAFWAKNFLLETNILSIETVVPLSAFSVFSLPYRPDKGYSGWKRCQKVNLQLSAEAITSSVWVKCMVCLPRTHHLFHSNTSSVSLFTKSYSNHTHLVYDMGMSYCTTWASHAARHAHVMQ